MKNNMEASNHQEQPEDHREPETSETLHQDSTPDSEAHSEELQSSESSEPDREHALEAENADLRDQLLRKAAEMENIRKRIQRDRIQLFDQSKAAAIEAFLPVNDDLQRTLDALKVSNPDPAFLEGIQLVADKFASVLESFGVEKISEIHIPFDVNIHEALLRQPAPNPEMTPDTVLQVLENGYRIGDKVLRHAKVIVSE